MRKDIQYFRTLLAKTITFIHFGAGSCPVNCHASTKYKCELIFAQEE